MSKIAVAIAVVLAMAGLLMSLAMAQAQSEPRSPSFMTKAQSGAAAAESHASTQRTGPMERAWLWILEGQRELTNGMTAAVRQLKSGDLLSSAAILGAISFLYGVLHAAGPGHGKFVISSYALATERTMRRGVLLSFMAAFVQAISAIVIVGVLAIALKATSLQIRATEAWLETASWGLIALLGAWLLFGQIRRLRGNDHAKAVPVHDAHDGHDHHHGDAGHAKAGHAHHHAHAHAEDGSCCGHVHIASPSQLAGQWSWPKAWSLALSIGIRPCTGAIGVLIFALGLGIFWAGVFATFTMAIGTALTVSALASVAVGSRQLATRLAGGDSVWAGRVATVAGLAGSAMVFALGTTFFLASLSGAGPL